MAVKISGVKKGSVAEKKKIRAGDSLISVDGNAVNDALDYYFYTDGARLLLDLASESGGRRLVPIKKGEREDLGLEFETYLMDERRSCKNKCVFCFIDQLPKGLRKSLYFKDDDSRLSFLFGNYITLTNMNDAEAERIIKMKLSPVNVSVHTTNPELRVKMTGNPRAGESLEYLRAFAKAGIAVNAQLVLCPGINDGRELERSLAELGGLYPSLKSVAAVPVGLSGRREGLYPLRLYDKKSAGAVIDAVDAFNKDFLGENGEIIAYAADEFYIYAEREIPPAEYYGDFPQLENGVGMWALLKSEFEDALEKLEAGRAERRITAVTGKAAYPLVCELARKAEKKLEGLSIKVIAAENVLFGGTITVSGLICGADALAALKGVDIGDELLIPPDCLKRDEDIFLDGMTLREFSDKLGVKVTRSGRTGEETLRAMIGPAALRR